MNTLYYYLMENILKYIIWWNNILFAIAIELMINLVNLTFFSSMDQKNLWRNRDGSRLPFGKNQHLPWSIKEKSYFKRRYCKILLPSLTKTISINQLSSIEINQQIKAYKILIISSYKNLLLKIMAFNSNKKVLILLINWNYLYKIEIVFYSVLFTKIGFWSLYSSFIK